MKTKNVLFLIGIFLIGICCSKECPEPDLQNPWIETKNNLIGTWTDLYTFSRDTYFFTENDTIIWNRLSGIEILTLSYQVVAEDSIKVTRNWETGEKHKTSTNKLIFHTYDTLEIIKFVAVDYGISGWQDALLYKIN